MLKTYKAEYRGKIGNLQSFIERRQPCGNSSNCITNKSCNYTKEMGKKGAIHSNFGKQFYERILYGYRQNEVYMNTVFQLEID